jgi:hypothetical protein
MPDGARLTCLPSMISEWHSCLGVFLKIRDAVNSLELNGLPILDLLSSRIPQMSFE